MSLMRTGHFETIDDVIADIAVLRRGYKQNGNWTLAQICWHIGRPIANHTNPPEPLDLLPTPEQARIKAAFVDYIITHKKAPPHIKEAPPSMVPPAEVAETEIDQYVGALHQLKAYPHAKVLMGPIGPVTTEEYRACNVFHAAHHLSFLTPHVSRRQGLRYADSNAIKADISLLRKGYKKAGSWSLPQACHHLEKALKAAMTPGPFPSDTSEQIARRPIMEAMMGSGRIPSGLVAPDTMTPPADTPESAIESFLNTLDTFDHYKQPLAPHRLFGVMSDSDRRRHQLMHFAHHLSYLNPTNPSSER